MNTENRGIEQAALMGSALAAFIALAVGVGGWTPLSSALGLTLALVLVAYVHIPTGSLRERLLRLLAIAAVVALDVCLALAYPLQEWFVRRRVIADCRKLSRLPSEVATCVGSATTPGLTVLWLIGGAVIFAI